MSFELQPILQGSLVEIRPLRAEDIDEMYAVASDPLIWELHPNNDRYRRDVFEAFFRANLDSNAAFAVLDLKTDKIIGGTRYNLPLDSTDEVEVGWTFLARSYWGGSYNGEMKRLMLDHAFRFVSRVCFTVGPDNRRSRRALEKIGARHVGNGIYPDGKPKVIYRIAAEEWREPTRE